MRLAVLGFVLLTACGAETSPNGLPHTRSTKTLRVFVAASFQDAVRGTTDARVQVAASSTLARQIYNGARATCFISANSEWMEYLTAHHCLEPGTRRKLATTHLVLIVPASRASDLDLGAFTGLLAMGDPSHVPAGKYGKIALQSMGVWRQLASRVVPTADVRAALVLVERDQVDAGIVYATDVRGSKRVRVVHEFAAPEVTYEIALVRGGDPALLTELTGPKARGIYQALGFVPAK